MDLRNKKVTVAGLGDSGVKAALLLESAGAIVSATDNNDNANIRENIKPLEDKYIELEIGGHTEPFLTGTELLVTSPGVENSSLPIRYAEEHNIPIISELELGFSFCRGTVLAVTGTNGKSTVVSLIGEILSRAGASVNVSGNIGNALSGEIDKIKKNTIVVLEVSSFQLERIKSFRPKISVILNITEDHLDRYPNFAEYMRAKKRIFENQKKGDIAILNYDDVNLRKLAKSGEIPSKTLYFSAKRKVEGIYLDGDNIKTFLESSVETLFGLGSTRLKGAHNAENILAAALAATLLKVKVNIIAEAVRNFTPLTHRFEKVAEINGVDFIDDSKATNIDSARRALLSADRPVILIAGGKDKNLSYESVSQAVKKRVKKIILIGETRPKMREAFKGITAVAESESLEEAVRAAYASAVPGDAVLLSPMCSSFDMFRDYKHRGDAFRRAAEGLKK